MKQDISSKPSFRSPIVFGPFPGLVAAESTRHGGVSVAPYHSLNLGGATKDTPENVTENNNRFFSALGIPVSSVAKSHQVHGTAILRVEHPGRFEGYDALITDRKNIQLAVTIADCTPVLIYDPVRKAMAAIHAGWRGTVGEIVKKTVLTMQQTYGCEPADCYAYIGTCIDACSFEVGDEVAEQFDPLHKKRNDEKGKFFVDLKAANRQQLLDTGLKEERIELSPFSTVIHNDDYFSYRHENGLTGRMLATIGLIG
ncbi:Polyphenol oxidase [Dyadobacter sp. CECT 9275]|uniref:Purine nucleoside phosphorylase n=1 Tax=Dyadobacter helix TaxID=2822344 RepID=A0A916NM12_9BACT|nr:peptidoglycan editing factor PgeF [Dyadobacter sp. CECT 9275]CAG5003741.1 Polyphenol oxidase [Dyadobacter sp. CECT 9275]